MLLRRFPGPTGARSAIGVTMPAVSRLDDTLVEGLTLQADQCLERGDMHGAILFIDLIYGLFDWADDDSDQSDGFTDAGSRILEVRAD